MSKFDILLERISQHREHFDVTQKVEDLDDLIRFEEQALKLPGEDSRRAGVAEQLESDLELRSAIALSEVDGMTQTMQTYADLSSKPKRGKHPN